MPQKYDFSNNVDASVIIVSVGITDIRKLVIIIHKVLATLILASGPKPAIANATAKAQALLAYETLDYSLKKENGGMWRPPNGQYFPSLDAYLDYLPENHSSPTENKTVDAMKYNHLINEGEANGMSVYIHLFCMIEILFFSKIQLGLTMENYADDLTSDPYAYKIAGQFQATSLGLFYSIAASTSINFNCHCHLHNLDQDDHDAYHRALVELGLPGAQWDISLGVSCVPGSACDAVVHFLR